MMVSARNDRNTPLPATWVRKAAPGPFPPPPWSPPWGTATRSADPSRIGIATTTASRARLRHRRNISPSSERSSRSHGRTMPRRTARTPPGCTAPGCTGTGATSAVDIEALTRQFHEQVLQARARRTEAGHRYSGQDQFPAQHLRHVVADLRADLAVAGLDVGKPEFGEQFRRLARLGGAHLDPGGAAGPHRLQG